MSSNVIRTLIVDDEPLALDSLRTLLREDDDIVLVGECSDGPTALNAIRETTPIPSTPVCDWSFRENYRTRI